MKICKNRAFEFRKLAAKNSWFKKYKVEVKADHIVITASKDLLLQIKLSLSI